MLGLANISLNYKNYRLLFYYPKKYQYNEDINTPLQWFFNLFKEPTIFVWFFGFMYIKHNTCFKTNKLIIKKEL